MKIPVKTSKEKFYRQILEIFKIFPPVSHLRPKEMSILAELMRQNDEYRTLSRIKRRMIILSKESKEELRSKFELSSASLNNILTVFRKYKILNKDNDLAPIFDIVPDKKFTIEIELLTDEAKNN